jgi:hypothetical protein
MKFAIAALFAGFYCLHASELIAEVQVAFEQLDAGTGFTFEKIASPATNDAGTQATWKLVDGDRDSNSAGLTALHDGRVPAGDDDPRTNFFFGAGSDGGRILTDLGKVLPVKRISSYSRHAGDRAPQVYSVYGSNGDIPGFIREPGRDKKPEEHGWKKIASVDTRPPKGDPGGRHGVSITDSEAMIGPFRYLMFAVEPTEKHDSFGLTFFSEIDIVSADGPELKFVAAGNPLTLVKFQSQDAKYQFQIDLTEAPDLKEWSETDLVPVIQGWYPKIVEMLPSEGFQAATTVKLRYRNDMPAAIPASASGSNVNLNAPWFRNHLKDEAKGCVIHELVHVVQDYWQMRRGNPKAAPTPSWFVEGLADYIRWFLYEPDSRGAQLSPKRLAEARHDAGYRVSAHFIDWAVRTHDKDLVGKLNAAARAGKYDDSLWEIHTRKRLSDLADEWRKGE